MIVDAAVAALQVVGFVACLAGVPHRIVVGAWRARRDYQLLVGRPHDPGVL